MEEWKPIEECPDYQISNKGNVMSYKRNKEIVLKTVMSHRGYLSVKLSHYGVRKMYKVHQLVLKHFGPPQPPNTTPDHINRVKTENDIQNLRWATPEEQRENSVPAKGESHGSARLTEVQVIEIKRRLKEKANQAKLAKEYGVGLTQIKNIKAGKRWAYLNI
jgi:hypothetical protein